VAENFSVAPALTVADAEARKDSPTRHGVSGPWGRALAIPVVALGCTLAACSGGSHATAQQERTVAGILTPQSARAPQTGHGAVVTAGPRSTTTTAPPAPAVSPPGAGTAPAAVAAASAAAQSAATASSGAGTPPDVVGQDVAGAETALHASGYSTAAHPWAATCSAANLVMQQEPPEYGTIQLFYCAAPEGP
jgi:hypothetical protein